MIFLTYKQAMELIRNVVEMNERVSKEEEVQLALDMLEELVDEERKEKYNETN